MAKRKAEAAAAGSRLDLLLHLVDHAYDKQAWHGPTLRGALRGVTLDEALFRPAPGRHTIWELVLHAAYWKYAAWRQLTRAHGEGAKRGGFPLAGSNWFPQPAAPSRRDWQAALRLLAGSHTRLRETIAAFPEERLDERPPKIRHRYGELIAAIAAHDLYHAGQVSLLKRLAAPG
jgi:DinB family protein